MICWTLGITEHHNAVDNVLALINLSLLCGHVGRYGSGLNPLRGQNNVQGGGDMGAIPNKLPGFQDMVNLAQLVVTGFTLPLVAKFAAGYAQNAAGSTAATGDLDLAARAFGWQMTMGLWAIVCVFFFLITFATTRERVIPDERQRSSIGQSFADLLQNNPWKVMFAMTLVHFAILSFRGLAFYDYYHNYADPLPCLRGWQTSA